MKKELQLPEFKDLCIEDFNCLNEKSEVGRILRKSFRSDASQASYDLYELWGVLDEFEQFDEARKKQIRECYVELAEASFMTQSVAYDVGQLILSGVVLSKVLKKIERLKEDVAKERKDKTANSRAEWEELTEE